MKVNGDIEFKNINFSYPTKKDVEILNNFNLKIKPGMRLGIVGASGSGKSTIISLLQRLYNCGKSDNIILNNEHTNNKLKSKDEYIELPNINGDSELLDSKLIDSDTEIIKLDNYKLKEPSQLGEIDDSQDSYIGGDNNYLLKKVMVIRDDIKNKGEGHHHY